MINTHKDHPDGDELIRKSDIYDILDNDYLVADRKEERLRGLRGVESDTDGDLISRADAIEAIASRDETDGTVKVFTGRQVNEILTALPSAQPKRGEWIWTNEKKNQHKCSACGEVAYSYYDELADDVEELYDYCPNCGCKMEVEP